MEKLKERLKDFLREAALVLLVLGGLLFGGLFG